MNDRKPLPPEGFVRLRQIIGPAGPLPVSRSSFYAGIKAGRWPAPRKCGAMSLWSVVELRASLARLESSAIEPVSAGNAHPSPRSSPEDASSRRPDYLGRHLSNRQLCNSQQQGQPSRFFRK